jgi:hypothetical protein
VEYSYDYFDQVRLTGDQVTKYQNQLLDLKRKVVDLLANLGRKGKAFVPEALDLKKISDFINLVDQSKLDEEEFALVEELVAASRDHETLQLKLTLEALSDMYEVGFPRIMYVLRRGLKIILNNPPTSSDEKLLSPPNYMDWIKANLDQSHVLVSYYADDKPRNFYKFARNVASHHRALRMDWDRNFVDLEDQDETLSIPINEFQQRYRYLNYLVDYGVRGILYHFSDVERGEISFAVSNSYEKIFPDHLSGRASRVVRPY